MDSASIRHPVSQYGRNRLSVPDPFNIPYRRIFPTCLSVLTCLKQTLPVFGGHPDSLNGVHHSRRYQKKPVCLARKHQSVPVRTCYSSELRLVPIRVTSKRTLVPNRDASHRAWTAEFHDAHRTHHNFFILLLLTAASQIWFWRAPRRGSVHLTSSAVEERHSFC